MLKTSFHISEFPTQKTHFVLVIHTAVPLVLYLGLSAGEQLIRPETFCRRSKNFDQKHSSFAANLAWSTLQRNLQFFRKEATDSICSTLQETHQFELKHRRESPFCRRPTNTIWSTVEDSHQFDLKYSAGSPQFNLYKRAEDRIQDAVHGARGMLGGRCGLRVGRLRPPGREISGETSQRASFATTQHFAPLWPPQGTGAGLLPLSGPSALWAHGRPRLRPYGGKSRGLWWPQYGLIPEDMQMLGSLDHRLM